MVDALRSSLRPVGPYAEKVLLSEQRIPQTSDHGLGLMRQELAENDVPEPVSRKVPQDGADLAHLVHEAHTNSLLCIIKGQHLYIAEADAPRGCLSQEWQHTCWVAEDHGRCARGKGRRQALEVLQWVHTCDSGVRIRRQAFEAHTALYTLEALEAKRTSASAHVEVLFELARRARRQDNGSKAGEFWAGLSEDSEHQSRSLPALRGTLYRDEAFLLVRES
mmetsp:Transcript_120050/g.299458  ORF Transcript_120050/g.299458 Transcript_120050/m.299458 type:complete len:221 (-) Transcript_120050:339-1001(-)